MKKLLIAVLICTAVLSGCGERKCKDKPQDTPDVKTEQKTDEKKTEQKTEQKTQNKSEDKQQAEAPKVTGDELSEMVNEFSSLKDGDPRKEELREKLEAILSQAEQVN